MNLYTMNIMNSVFYASADGDKQELQLVPVDSKETDDDDDELRNSSLKTAKNEDYKNLDSPEM